MNAPGSTGMAEEVVHNFLGWTVCCQPTDGGRITRLAWDGRDLLTPPPARFAPPQGDFGAYERRAVYGYDDCWPSVEPCTFPGRSWSVPDHGELCWLPWETASGDDAFIARVSSALLPVTFERRLRFAIDRVTWRFRISNRSDAALPCQHVMHPLLRLTSIRELHLPAFAAAWDAIGARPLLERSPAAIGRFLRAQPSGTAAMIFLQDVQEGRYVLERHDGLSIEVLFPTGLFPTLGIWWNHSGYPFEQGCQRDECAFEPVPGPTSNLADAAAAGATLCLHARETLEWTCEWRVTMSSRQSRE